MSTMGFVSNLEILNFVQSDVGEYQCIFTDTDTEAEIITTIPFRVDTGTTVCFHANDLNIITGIITFVDIFTELNGISRSTIILERVSSEVIFLRPPEKLVIEVKSSGRFARIDWQRNGVPIVRTQEEFSNHYEIFVREPTR